MTEREPVYDPGVILDTTDNLRVKLPYATHEDLRLYQARHPEMSVAPWLELVELLEGHPEMTLAEAISAMETLTYVSVHVEDLRKVKEACPSEPPQGVPVVRFLANNTFISALNTYHPCGHTHYWKDCAWWAGKDEGVDDVCQVCLPGKVAAGELAVDLESLTFTLAFLEAGQGSEAGDEATSLARSEAQAKQWNEDHPPAEEGRPAP